MRKSLEDALAGYHPEIRGVSDRARLSLLLSHCGGVPYQPQYLVLTPLYYPLHGALGQNLP